MNPPPGPRSSQPALGPGVWRVDALGVFDALETDATPGSILLGVELDCRALGMGTAAVAGTARVLAVGTPEEVARHPAAAAARTVKLPDRVLLPGLINAHTHLDLTHIGPHRYDEAGGFMGWVEMIRAERPGDDESIATSVRAGIALSLQAGVVAVGDIAGAPRGVPNLTPWRTLTDSPLGGVSFLEFFALGGLEGAGLARMNVAIQRAGVTNRGRMRFGLQPHAPNTVSPRGYREAVQVAQRLGLPLATHLAETLEERELVAVGTGPQREFMERLGAWNADAAGAFGHGLSPAAHLGAILASGKFAASHLNDVSDRDIELLAETGTSVVYCPRAAEYFGAERQLGAHRYADMARVGVNVALGTDSVVNLPEGSDDPGRGRLGVFHEMRRLRLRDGVDGRALLRMATVNGAMALGLDPMAFELREGAIPAGLITVRVPAESDRVLDAALGEGADPELLFIRN